MRTRGPFLVGTLAEIEEQAGVRIQVLTDRILVQLGDGSIERWHRVDREPADRDRIHFDGQWYALESES